MKGSGEQKNKLINFCVPGGPPPHRGRRRTGAPAARKNWEEPSCPVRPSVRPEIRTRIISMLQGLFLIGFCLTIFFSQPPGGGPFVLCVGLPHRVKVFRVDASGATYVDVRGRTSTYVYVRQRTSTYVHGLGGRSRSNHFKKFAPEGQIF